MVSLALSFMLNSQQWITFSLSPLCTIWIVVRTNHVKCQWRFVLILRLSAKMMFCMYDCIVLWVCVTEEHRKRTPFQPLPWMIQKSDMNKIGEIWPTERASDWAEIKVFFPHSVLSHLCFSSVLLFFNCMKLHCMQSNVTSHCILLLLFNGRRASYMCSVHYIFMVFWTNGFANGFPCLLLNKERLCEWMSERKCTNVEWKHVMEIWDGIDQICAFKHCKLRIDDWRVRASESE